VATVAKLGDSHDPAEWEIRRQGTLEAEEAPRLWAWRLGAGYFTAETNARHALAGTLSVALLRSLVSRTITAPAVVATSTHSPPLAPE
jgi:hypothetical protein